MYQKIIKAIEKHKDIIIYLFFGVLTTIVNYVVYLPLYNVFAFPATASNIIAWVVAVLFAFFTNKPFVFRSHDWSAKVTAAEFVKFVGSRIGSGAVETVVLFVAVDLLHGSGNIFKLLTSVLVVVMNYVTSKLFVFKNHK